MSEKDSKYYDYELRRTGKCKLKFKGYKLAEVKAAQGPDHKMVFTLFETSGGNLVGYKTCLSKLLGVEHDYEAKVCKTETEVLEFFGQSTLALALYQESKIDNSEIIE